MLLITPSASYDETSGAAFIRPFEAMLEEATDRLAESSTIVRFHSDSSRRLPGRNFVLGDKSVLRHPCWRVLGADAPLARRYLASFEGAITGRNAFDAQRADASLHGNGSEADADTEEVWPVIVEDGEMMALVRLVSEGTVWTLSDAPRIGTDSITCSSTCQSTPPPRSTSEIPTTTRLAKPVRMP